LVTLTFDDGPNPATTPKILDILAKYNVKATFFVLGSRGASHPALLQRIAREGHIVANHSINHPNFWSLSEAEARRQIQTTDGVIRPYIISSVKFFRYPYGNSTCTANNVLGSLGYQRAVGWHVDTCDWAITSGYLSPKQAKACGGTPGKVDIAGHFLRVTERKGGGVVLMHDIHASTANNLERYIAGLQQRGYRFTNLDNARAYPNLNRR